jgi:hypothetical protein
MSYKEALNKSWEKLGDSGTCSVRFLNDEYEVDASSRKIFSLSCNIEAKDYYKILILHYLANEKRISEIEKDKWISFKELEGGEAYFSAFRKRAIGPILRKYQENPTAILERIDSLNAQKMDEGNASVSVTAFPKVKVGIVLWARDEEFGADCNMLFNESIKSIFPTEDVAVLGGIVAARV